MYLYSYGGPSLLPACVVGSFMVCVQLVISDQIDRALVKALTATLSKPAMPTRLVRSSFNAPCRKPKYPPAPSQTLNPEP